jgi:hypothetical protein
VGELPLDAQAAFLPFLGTRGIRPVGLTGARAALGALTTAGALRRTGTGCAVRYVWS